MLPNASAENLQEQPLLKEPPLKETTSEKEVEMANNHYDQGGFSARHILRAFLPKNMTPHQVTLWWNVGKYILRCGFKHPEPDRDLEKAAEYLEWLIHDRTTSVTHYTRALAGLIARTVEVYQASPEQLELIRELRRELALIEGRTVCQKKSNDPVPDAAVEAGTTTEKESGSASTVTGEELLLEQRILRDLDLTLQGYELSKEQSQHYLDVYWNSYHSHN